jgi:murein DD-endopeptidase MepM/ murein hydrolase activator NlpD
MTARARRLSFLVVILMGLWAALAAASSAPVRAADGASAPAADTTGTPPTTLGSTGGSADGSTGSGSGPDGATTTTDPASATSTTVPPLGVTPTTNAPEPAIGATTTTTAPAAAPRSATSDSSTSTTTPVGPPPDAADLALQNSIDRTPPSSTSALLAALAPLGKLGFSQEQMALVGFGQFPVAGAASYSDDFMVYRATPEPHMHMGIDIAAADGTPLRSPAAGILTYSDSDPDGYGLTAIVTQPDKTYFLLAHMSATVLGLASGTQVTVGEVIGFIGSSGDATGSHLHFEVHPGGGAATDPKPILDGYLRAALAAVPQVLARYEGSPTTGAPVTVPPTAPQAVPAPVVTASGPSAQPALGQVAAAGRRLPGARPLALLLLLVTTLWAGWTLRRTIASPGAGLSLSFRRRRRGA